MQKAVTVRVPYVYEDIQNLNKHLERGCRVISTTNFSSLELGHPIHPDNHRETFECKNVLVILEVPSDPLE